MKSYTILRGIDNELEFKGLRGKYFYYAAGGAMATLMLGLLLHVFGMPAIITIILVVTGLGTSYLVPNNLFKKYGRWGTEKMPISTMQPKHIRLEKSFYSQVPTRKFPRK